MSRQSSLDQFFPQYKSSSTSKTQNSSFSPATTVTPIMQNIIKKRRTLTLLKNTPEKAPKMSDSSLVTVKIEGEVVNLCSDDEEEILLYDEKGDNSIQNSNLSPATSSSQTLTNNITPLTPKKSPKPSTSKSRSSEKFFSPTKKRVIKRTPLKQSFALTNFNNSSQLRHDLVDDEDFNKACEGLDDKSIFLLTIINKCLKEDSLKALLDEKSSELLNNALNTIKPGIRLVCRLYWRQDTWCKREKLVQITNDRKEPVGDAKFMEMLQCLVENGLIEPSVTLSDKTMDLDDLMKVLNFDEVKQVCKDLNLKYKSKQDTEQKLRHLSQQKPIGNYFTQKTTNNSTRVLNVLRSKAGTCYKLSGLARSALNKLYLLMYLGINYERIREKKLELMLINDKIKTETYPVDKDMELDNASVVFKSKEEFARYWKAHLIYEDYLTKVDSAEKCKIVANVYKLYKEIDEEYMIRYKALPTWLRRYTPPYVYVKILADGIKELKREESLRELALDILTTLISQTAFRQHKRAEWYAEKALVLQRYMGKHDEAARVLIEGLQSSMSEEAKDAMRPRANIIAKLKNIQLDPVLKKALIEYGSKELILEKSFHAEHVRKQHEEITNQRGKKKFEVHTNDGKKWVEAEEYCVIYYTTNGDYTHGEHWEGRFIITLYYLLFWDIIYSRPRDVCGVFLSRYQQHPLDMYDASFYENRKTAIDERLRQIEAMTTDEMVDTLKQKWDERPECELSGVSRSAGWGSVAAVSRCVPPRAAAALCRRLAAHYGYSHSGFPDLTLWNVHTNKIKFVEVKTDTDKPSMKQLQWMQYLRDCGLETGFCYLGVASERSRGRARAAGAAVTVRTVDDINDIDVSFD